MKQEVYDKFISLKEKWKQETACVSSLTTMYNNIHYQAIIGLGQDVVPILLKEMVDDPDWWDFALRKITGAYQDFEGDFGSLQKTAEIWIAWGVKQGLLEIEKQPQLYGDYFDLI